jgi:hypothetical protein
VRADHAPALGPIETPVLVIDSAGVDDMELPAALRELCSRIGLRVVAPYELAPGKVVLLAHIRADGDELELSVEEAETRKLIGQRRVPRGESQALSRETLAHVLLGLVEPWLERARRAQAEPPPPQELPSAPPKERVAWLPSLGLGAGPIALAQNQWSARLAGHSAFTAQRPTAPTVAVDLSGAAPVAVQGEGVQARFWLVGARLRGRISAVARPRGGLDVALSAGVDLLGFKPVSAVDGTSLASLSLRAQAVFGGALTGRVRLPRAIDLVFGVGADVDPKPREWKVSTEGMESTLLRPYTVRPYALVGLDFTLHTTPQKAQAGP